MCMTSELFLVLSILVVQIKLYEDRLKILPPLSYFLLEEWKLDETSYTLSRDVSPPHNVEPTAVLYSSSVSVEMEGCEDVQCALTEFLSVEKNSPINIHCNVHAVYVG